MGGAYSFIAPKDANASTAVATASVEEGQKLFLGNCASCHGTNAQGTQSGPSLVGVGAAAVDFQVGTGRMPMARPDVQAPRNDVKFDDDEIASLAAYVATLGPGPAIPDKQFTTVIEPGTPENNRAIAEGGVIFRVNCAMCHNVAAAGGALTEGKYAPALGKTSALHMYAAMVTGPQNMPVFSDMNLTTEDKRDIISSLLWQQETVSPGGFTLGSLGPVSEGLFIWIFGIGGLIALTVWITAKSN